MVKNEKIPILVTGGEGMLGCAFAQMAAHFPRFQIFAPGKQDLDVRDLHAVNRWSERIAGGWVVHCAARVDVEGCAREPDAARETIVTGTENVARLLKASGARMLYPQSFLTYDGATNPIAEDEIPRPLSFYGELKYAAEQRLVEIVDDPLIIRMAGFFGGEAADKNFVGRIIPVMHKTMVEGEKEFKVGDRVWQPTWTNDLAFNCLHLMERDACGSYQMACRGQASFAELAQEIVIALGWQDHLEIATVLADSVEGSELGRRPAAAILSCARLDRENANLQRPWQSTLHAYLHHPFFDQFRLESRRP